MTAPTEGRIGATSPDDESLTGSTTISVLAGLVALGALVGRFVVSTPMWLDEALTLTISRTSFADILEHLRHDGHPPLYYLLSHVWMSIAGDGVRSARSLSGVISLALVAVMWRLGRRLGGRAVGQAAALVTSVSPFVLRYGSENRMYALVMLEVALLLLFVARRRDGSSHLDAVGIAVSASALLWTHYWGAWVVAAVFGTSAVVELRRRRGSGDPAEPGGEVAILVALVVAGLTFLPWLPTLRFQLAHTGTPWAPAGKPPAMVFASLVEFAGGPYTNSQLVMLVFVVAAFLGTFGRRRGDLTEVDYRVQPAVRDSVWLIVGVLIVASAAQLALGTAFAPRYASVFLPSVVVLIAFGCVAVPAGRRRDVALVVFLALSVVSLVVVGRLQRSQSGVVVDRLASLHDPFVVACPDQLGPSLRVEAPRSIDIVSYPTLGDPRFVDWVDYKERNRHNDPDAAATRALDAARGRPIVVVFRDDFLTLKGQCSRFVSAIAAGRSSRELVVADPEGFYEPMNAVVVDG